MVNNVGISSTKALNPACKPMLICNTFLQNIGFSALHDSVALAEALRLLSLCLMLLPLVSILVQEIDPKIMGTIAKCHCVKCHYIKDYCTDCVSPYS